MTISSYIKALESLFVLKDIDAWTPQIRSKTAIRSAKKHIFVDPSIGLAALGIEADAVYQLPDGRYALIEIKTGTTAIPKAEKGLLRFRNIIRAHNENALSDKNHPGVIYREPTLLIIICANAEMAYTTEEGVKVIPVGCLRD